MVRPYTYTYSFTYSYALWCGTDPPVALVARAASDVTIIVYEYVYRFAVYVYGFMAPNAGLGLTRERMQPASV